MRAHFTMLVLPLVAAVCGPGAAAEQAAAYPSKSIRVIVPFAAGGGTDLIARITAQKLTEAWGQQVIVDNLDRARGASSAPRWVCARRPTATRSP